MTDVDLTLGIPDDLTSRIAERRRALGLGVDDVAQRAGLEAGYLRHVEEQHATPSPYALARLAEALETRVADLLGQGRAEPDGQGSAAPGPTLERLDHAASLALLAPGGVGRLAMTRVYAPVVLPVNYVLAGDDVVIRTAPSSQVATAAGHGDAVAFEVDHLDEVMSAGWSVVATGRLELVPEEEAEALRQAVSAWAGDEQRPTIVRLRPGTVTGRRIRAGD